MHPFLNKAIQAARRSAQIIRQSMDRLDRVSVEVSADGHLVSSVDRSSEAAILDLLSTAYPDHTLVARESGTVVEGAGEFTWFIDPLNGNTNFLYGIPDFVISIACCGPEKIEHGLILDPVREQQFSASFNQGALLNQRRIRVSDRSDIRQAMVAVNLHHKAEGDAPLPAALAVSRLARGVRYSGSRALDLAYTAAGRLDLMLDTGCPPWEIAAGLLLVREAGGRVIDFSEEQYCLKNGQLIAGVTRQVDQALKALGRR